MIEVRNLSFKYADDLILDNINLSIQRGDVLAILGENGSGKSTLLKLILSFLEPLKGEVLIDNKNVNSYEKKDLAKKIAYVPQSSTLPFSYTVLEVVLMARISYQSIFSTYSNKDKEIAIEALKHLEIENLKEKVFSDLSGGQKQLVLIARALAQKAEILIMDEPSSSLDYSNELMLLNQIKKLAKKGFTVIQATHNPNHAFFVSSKTLLIKDKKVFAFGKSSEILTQNNINSLYDIEVELYESSEKIKFCIPKFNRD